MTDEHPYRTFVHSEGYRRVVDYYGACECGAHSLPMVRFEDAERWTCPRADAEAEITRAYNVRSSIAAYPIQTPFIPAPQRRPYWPWPLDEAIKHGW